MECQQCNRPISNNRRFCGSSCSAKYNNVRRAARSLESRRKTAASVSAAYANRSTQEKERRIEIGRELVLIRRKRDYDVNPITDSTKRKISKALTGRSRTNETKLKLSEAAKRRGFGGHTSKRKINYTKPDGSMVYLQSSYESRFATILDELGVHWERPSPFIWVDAQGATHRYYPDFKVGDLYIDTKNSYLVVRDKDKIERVRSQNNIDLRVVTEDQINRDFIASVVQW